MKQMNIILRGKLRLSIKNQHPFKLSRWIIQSEVQQLSKKPILNSINTDYNGVYKGKYIDFEAKETQNPTSFPLKNFHQHQIRHMEEVLNQGWNLFCYSSFYEI